MNDTADEILEQISKEWRAVLYRHRDESLKIGRLLHRYLMQGLQEKIARAKLVKQAAARIAAGTSAIQRMVGAAMVVELLAENRAVGTLPFETLRAFIMVIERQRGTREERAAFTEREVWQIKPQFPNARELFQAAVAERWECKKTWETLKDLAGKNHSPSVRLHKRKDRGSADEPPARSVPQPVHEAVRHCGPRDAAELLYATIMANDDPAAVARYLVPMLNDAAIDRAVLDRERAQRQKKARKQYAEAS